MVVCCDVQLVLSHVGLMRIRCTTIRKLPRLSFFHNPVDDTFHEELHIGTFFSWKVCIYSNPKNVSTTVYKGLQKDTCDVRRELRKGEAGANCEVTPSTSLVEALTRAGKLWPEVFRGEGWVGFLAKFWGCAVFTFETKYRAQFHPRWSLLNSMPFKVDCGGFSQCTVGTCKG